MNADPDIKNPPRIERIHDPIAGAGVQTRGDRVMLAEVPGEIDPFYPRVFFRDGPHGLPRIFGAAIVHQNDLKGVHQRLQHGYELAVEFRDAVSAAVDGRDN